MNVKNTVGPFEAEEKRISIVLEPEEQLYVKLEFDYPLLNSIPQSKGLQILFDRPNERIVYFLTNIPKPGKEPKTFAKFGIDYYAGGEYITGLKIHPIYGALGLVEHRARLKPQCGLDEQLVRKAVVKVNESVIDFNQVIELELINFNPFAKTLYEQFQANDELATVDANKVNKGSNA